VKLETLQAKPTGVTRKKKESVQRLISRFKRVFNDSGVMEELKERRHYEKKSERKRREKKKTRLLMKRQRREDKKLF
jgi:small subunit ribosomal protein S21